MLQTFKFKLIKFWNRVLHRLMISDQRATANLAIAQPSYDELSSTLSAIPDLMFELDEEGLHWDARVLRPELLVAPEEQLLGRTVTEVLPPEAAQIVMRALKDAKQNGYSHGKQILLPTPLGKLWFEISIARKETTNDETAKPKGTRFIVLSRDINERKLALLEAEKLAYHDQLTNLPNRYAIKNNLVQKIAAQQAEAHYFAILFLDLDKFKEVNDQKGHHTGDQLLKSVAQRLNTVVREEDMLIRWGGDEFIILINGLSANQYEAHQQTKATCKQIVDEVNKPYNIGKDEFLCRLSIGVQLFNDPETDVEKIIQQADAAMYLAKKSNKPFEFYHI